MKFLQGTYGIDLLSLFLFFLGSLFNMWKGTFILGYVLLILGIYRAFSKKEYKRKQELIKFISLINSVFKRFNKSIPYNLPVFDLNNLSFIFQKISYWFNEKKNFKITKCPSCGQKLRLPRGKGKIVVSCKKCSTKFDLKT
ncbi:hypothetical protein [Clostridium sp.]|uniref:hypothetical protein n=1 Tax=Clostridium sp. TaxID=1506 RepID=UPI003F36F4B3